MRREFAVLGSALFLAVAPGIVAGYVPWRITGWHVGVPLLGTSSFRLVGALLIAAGLPVLLDSFTRFALQGLGTPAPVFPTRHLVVSGLLPSSRDPARIGHKCEREPATSQSRTFGSVRNLPGSIQTASATYRNGRCGSIALLAMAEAPYARWRLSCIARSG